MNLFKTPLATKIKKIPQHSDPLICEKYMFSCFSLCRLYGAKSTFVPGLDINWNKRTSEDKRRHKKSVVSHGDRRGTLKTGLCWCFISSTKFLPVECRHYLLTLYGDRHQLWAIIIYYRSVTVCFIIKFEISGLVTTKEDNCRYCV